ncbi:phage tail length tape measure family protein [Methylobacterium organophilum]|uniref:phage tail length tape measure family protein n=2 Tax=Bacteria TaxID=2 RepID=UPI001F12EBAB|nr:phage tail length tape measure family protein [Methylobacterium organophilum]UMY16665.1 phage tail length tape measure family protein [Methylobacterium organophilum]
MPTSIAIRLAVEGGAEVKRSLEDAGRAGQAAFQGVGAAADAAGAATDRQTAKFQRLAQAAREAEAQARAQANVNALLGVGAGTAGSARESASAFEQELARQDQIQAARQEQAARSAQANINTLLGVRDAQIGAARASASVFEEAYRREAEALKQTADLRTTAIRNATSGWRDLGSAGAAALANIEASRRLGSLGVAPQAANGNTRLRSDQVQNLLYQGGDVLAQLGSGSPLSMIAFQQGPQIAQTFAGPQGASVRGAFAQAGEAASGLLARITPVVAGFGLLTTAVGLGAAALATYRSGQKELEQQLQGVGRASQTSVSQINAIAQASAMSGGVSIASAREMAGQFAATGRIGSEMYAGLIGVARDYATMTGQDLPDATRLLAAAFADPVKGADQLNEQLGFLDAATQKNIRTLAQQGNSLGAQKLLFDSMAGSIQKADERLGFFARGWERFKAASSNEIEAIGNFIDRGLGGGDAETRLRALQGQLNFRQRNMGAAGGLFDSLLGFDIETIRADIAKVQAEIDKGDREGSSARQRRRGLEIQSLVDGQDGATRQIEEIEAKAENIRRYFRENWLDPYGAAKRSMDGFVGQARQLREDLQAGGSSFAESLRQSGFQQRTVGFTQQGLSAAQINETAASREREAYRAGGPQNEIFAKLQSIEMERITQLQTLNAQTALQETQLGGAFSRLSSTVQRQILDASQEFGKVPASIIAAIAGKESSGNPNVGFSKVLGEDGRPSSAYGLGQITRGTAEEAVRLGYLPRGYDRTDPATMAQGIAAVLQMKIDQNGGDLNRGIMAYRGSNDPSVNRAYLTEVLRRSGQMGDATEAGVARDQDANARALQQANDNLRLNTEYYGKNGLQLEASTRAAQQYQEMLARGVPASEALAKSLLDVATQSATAAQRLKLVQYASDSTFEREQLGRSSSEQSAYSRARSLVGDTSTPAAQFIVQQELMNANLRETKQLATDAFGGFLSDISHGVSAMTALSNAFSRFADRLLSVAADKAISSLFGNLLGGGGSGGILGSFLGGGDSPTGGVRLFSSGGYTGPGDKSAPRGIVHAGEIVWSQDDVARVGGVAIADAIRRGGRGYAEGGIVGAERFTSPSPAAFRPAGGGSGLNVIVNEAPGGDRAQPRMERGPDGNPRIVVDMISRQQASDLAQGRGPLVAGVSGGRRLRG